MMECFSLLVLASMLITAESMELSAQRCFLYPISEYESSPWYTIPGYHDTLVVLESMPMRTPVNITIKNNHNEGVFCLLSINLINLRIYGPCIHGIEQTHPLNETIEDKSIILHVRESISYISVEDVIVNFDFNHQMPELIDYGDISEEMKLVADNNQYKVQITSDITPEDRLHAAIGCEYDTDDECTMEFGKTILNVKDEITLMALRNSLELKGEVNVIYGNSELTRSKPLQIALPSFDDDDTWKEVVTIIPSFIDRGNDNDGYILYIDSRLIHSPRSPGLVGTVKEKKLILDFTKTENIRWGVPCPEKPETLININTTGITTLDNDAEIFISEGTNEEKSHFTDMISGELTKISNLFEDSKSKLLERKLELQPESDYESESNIKEIAIEDDFEIAIPIKSSAANKNIHTTIMFFINLLPIFMRYIFSLLYNGINLLSTT